MCYFFSNIQLFTGICEMERDQKKKSPMHIEITPKRQSLPPRFISFNKVATQRAPEMAACKFTNKVSIRFMIDEQN